MRASVAQVRRGEWSGSAHEAALKLVVARVHHFGGDQQAQIRSEVGARYFIDLSNVETIPERSKGWVALIADIEEDRDDGQLLVCAHK